MRLRCLSFAAVILLASCGTSGPAINPTEVAFLLSGSYATTITALDIIHFESLDDLTITQGEWVWIFNEPGDYIVNLNGLETARGDIVIEGDQIKVRITDVSGIAKDSPCTEQVGHFVWALEKGELSFTKIIGMCDVMDLVLTSRPLQLQP